MAMTPLQICEAVNTVRGEAIVVCTMTAMNVLDTLKPWHPLTISSVPLMGGAGSLGLGIALAQPQRKVIVLDGDSSLLMELGGLATIAGARPSNLYHLVFANGVQFNGNYCLDLADNGRADFAGIARSAGYASAEHWREAGDLDGLAALLQRQGPCFVELAVTPTPSKLSAENPAPQTTDARFTRMGDEGRTIMRTLGIP